MNKSMITDDMTYNERYTAIAYMVLGRLHAYTNETYAAAFVNETDYQRLGEAIQRAAMMQDLYEIAQIFHGALPDAEILFPGMSMPKLEVTQ